LICRLFLHQPIPHGARVLNFSKRGALIPVINPNGGAFRQTLAKIFKMAGTLRISAV
jgi:hypothetical protein